MCLNKLCTSLFATATIALVASGCVAIPAPTAAVVESAPTAAAAHEGHGTMAMGEEQPFDAMFIDGMIEHHQGAIDMAEMALEQAEHEEILALSEAIIAAQTGEIEQMSSWRAEWYPDLAPTEGMHMDMGDMTISEDASKPFDQRFIEAMISHHQGAVHMAEMALAQAEHEEIRTLAEAVIAAQTTEIEMMQGWLLDWYGVSQ